MGTESLNGASKNKYFWIVTIKNKYCTTINKQLCNVQLSPRGQN